MSDARWNAPREYEGRDGGCERPRVYERDRDDHDPRDALMHDLDLPRGESVGRPPPAPYPTRTPESRFSALNSSRPGRRSDYLAEVPPPELASGAGLQVSLERGSRRFLIELDHNEKAPRAVVGGVWRPTCVVGPQT